MQEISVKEIKRYDFIRTKKYVDDLLFDLKHEELYIYQNTEFDISEKYGWSRSKVVHLKKSFIIKIALSKGMDYEK